ncbi:MAG: methionyl-tRNA formyltransferase [Desulfobacteraceae bacterium]|nr:MAG: methionyl-tRNA formyltransferase [Desulfobacteraceae bacterium]
MNKAPSIIFFGTPEFAVPALHSLDKSRFKVSLVVTQPDRPKGRGRIMMPPPVKIAAQQLGYEILQPDSIRSDDFHNKIVSCSPDYLVVVAFGQFIPDNLLSLPRKYPVNIHPSLLPRYRGPAPIQWAVINGDHETGVTIMVLDSGMDSGDILLAETEKIFLDDTSATLHDRLAKKGAALLVTALEQIETNAIHPLPQDNARASIAPLLQKTDGRIDWTRDAEKIEAFIRGMTPWPGAFTFWGDMRLKLFKAKPVSMVEAACPGTIIQGFQDELRVSTGKGALSILEIQGSSGKRLTVRDFLRGTPILPGMIFT